MVFWLELNVEDRNVFFEYAQSEHEYDAAARVINDNDLPKDATAAVAAWNFRKTGGESRFKYSVVIPPPSPLAPLPMSRPTPDDFTDNGLSTYVELSGWPDGEGVSNVAKMDHTNAPSSSNTVSLPSCSRQNSWEGLGPVHPSARHQDTSSRTAANCKKQRRRRKVGKRQNGQNTKACAIEET